MKIRAADSTGCPFPQFVVEAESESDRIILKAFLSPQTFTKPGEPQPWLFHLHGCGSKSDVDGYTSFNFGWQKRPHLAPEGDQQQRHSGNDNQVDVSPGHAPSTPQEGENG